MMVELLVVNDDHEMEDIWMNERQCLVAPHYGVLRLRLRSLVNLY